MLAAPVHPRGRHHYTLPRLADRVFGVLFILVRDRAPTRMTTLRAWCRAQLTPIIQVIEAHGNLGEDEWLRPIKLATYRVSARWCGSSPKPPALAFGSWKAAASGWLPRVTSAALRPCRM